jgi:hypothetical protein
MGEKRRANKDNPQENIEVKKPYNPAIIRLFMYPGPESNRHEQSSSVFETDASTNSATGANWSAKVIIFVTPHYMIFVFLKVIYSGI